MYDLIPFTNEPMRLLENLFNRSLWASPVNVEYRDDHVYLTADMPGVDPSNLDLTFESGRLAVSGKRGDHTYRFVVDIGNDIDPDKIQAQLDNGVLTIEAEKKADAKPRKIALKAGATKTLGSGEGKAA